MSDEMKKMLLAEYGQKRVVNVDIETPDDVEVTVTVNKKVKSEATMPKKLLTETTPTEGALLEN